MSPGRSLGAQAFFLNPGRMPCLRSHGPYLASGWRDLHPWVLLPHSKAHREVLMPVSEGAVPQQCKRESSHAWDPRPHGGSHPLSPERPLSPQLVAGTKGSGIGEC